ncbi:OpgC domain-containing protein [uncultured Gordonia sp.]|uniref:OpgC domain-containing protein n=1 Tax=uncultured Gordonia sp. TaxID=198437 RepID=UPI00258D36EF|nr:OpgC domain-containing protein [uncultured Gordonia sp.]
MNRDLAIDVTRGLAIWSMITAHFADGAKIAMPTHVFPYVDGMSVFVLLSGFVLGLVHHRWIETRGLRFTYTRLAKRLAALYVCQLTLSLAAVAAGMAGFGHLTWLRPVDGWGQGLVMAVTMSYLPSGGNILLLYMVLMGSAFAVFPLLVRGWWRPVLAASVALYAVSQFAAPDWFYLVAQPSGARIQNWAGWQIMFVPALIVGWQWRRWDLAGRIERHLPAVVLVAAGIAVCTHYLVTAGPWHTAESFLGDKLEFGPARAVGAWVLVPAVYGLCRIFLSLWSREWLRPLLMSGTRSLDSYVIQALALVAVPILVVDRPWSPLLMTAFAIGVFGTCWAWAEVRLALGIDKLHRLPVILGAPVLARLTMTRADAAGPACPTTASSSPALASAPVADVAPSPRGWTGRREVSADDRAA